MDEIVASLRPCGGPIGAVCSETTSISATGAVLEDESSIQEATDRLTNILIDKICVAPGERVLDVGCGNGRPAIQLARTKGVEVVGITNSKHHFEQARERARIERMEGQVTFHLMDVNELAFPAESFHAALAVESISLMPEPLPAFQNVSRALRRGGRLGIASIVLSTPATRPDDRAFLDRLCLILTRPPLATLDTYAGLVRASGLELEELSDIGPYVIPRSFAALLPGSAAESATTWAEVGVSPLEAEVMVSALSRFSEMPEAGYALVVARRAPAS